MICIRHKSLIALVALILVAAVLLNPGVASARPRGMTASSTSATSSTSSTSSTTVPAGDFLGMLLNWILKAGWGMDPNGNTGASVKDAVDAGWGMDPNGGV